MEDRKKLIDAVKAARALLEDAGFKYTWVAGAESVDENPDNKGFTLNQYTREVNMPNIALLNIAADILKNVHRASGMSYKYMLMIILNNIVNVDDDDKDDEEK